MTENQLIMERLEVIHNAVMALHDKHRVQDFYSTDQFAKIVGRSEFTCREWCRHRRLRAQKRISGRGKHQSWVISHDELLRYQKEGLLPPQD